MRLKDNVAIITGAGRGIGRATALRFAQEGALVVIADIELEAAQSVAAEVKTMVDQIEALADKAAAGNGGSQPKIDRPAIVEFRRALPLEVDVTNRDSVKKMVQTVLDVFGRIDIMVNNAGIVRDAQLAKMTEENFDTVIDVNLKGVFNCTQAVTPTMIKQGSGVILSTASVVAPYGNYGQTNYVASKAGVVGMTKVWARELGRKGIRVNAVAPGFIETRLTAGIPQKVIDKLVERIAMGRLGQPEDVASAFAWLASAEAGYVNGHVLAVDGGTTI
jgi:3-oxoacyl-[acyl-carrier protein] reductase